MKKLLLVLAVASFVACNNKSDKKEGETKDSTKMETPKTDTGATKMSTDTMPK